MSSDLTRDEALYHHLKTAEGLTPYSASPL